MFYQPGRTDHGLPHDPFKACVIPRPIGWISTTSPTGQHNLAPYSQFNNLTFDPPYVMFSSNQTSKNIRKDTVVNAESTGVFCWQLATYPLREAVNITAEQVPPEVDEFERAGLEKEWSRVLSHKIPMVKDSPVKFECEYHTTLRLPGNPPMGTVDIVIGKVVGVHIDERVITDGKLDVRKTMPIARLGYYEYSVIMPQDVFSMVIPGDKLTLAGLEGSASQNRRVNEGKGAEGYKQVTGEDKIEYGDKVAAVDEVETPEVIQENSMNKNGISGKGKVPGSTTVEELLVADSCL